MSAPCNEGDSHHEGIRDFLGRRCWHDLGSRWVILERVQMGSVLLCLECCGRAEVVVHVGITQCLGGGEMEQV